MRGIIRLHNIKFYTRRQMQRWKCCRLDHPTPFSTESFAILTQPVLIDYNSPNESKLRLFRHNTTHAQIGVSTQPRPCPHVHSEELTDPLVAK